MEAPDYQVGAHLEALDEDVLPFSCSLEIDWIFFSLFNFPGRSVVLIE